MPVFSAENSTFYCLSRPQEKNELMMQRMGAANLNVTQSPLPSPLLELPVESIWPSSQNHLQFIAAALKAGL